MLVMKVFGISALCFTFVDLVSSPALAQSMITTYAGPSLPVDGSQAITQTIGVPQGVSADGAGGFYVSSSQNRVYHVGSEGTLTVIAGNGSRGFSGDNGLALSAQLNYVHGVAADSAGNVFIADTNNNRIRKVTPAGFITTVAGTGTWGSGGDGGPAVSSQLSGPRGVAVDQAGNLFIADTGNNEIRMVTAAGVISTVAGNGTAGFSGDGGPLLRSLPPRAPVQPPQAGRSASFQQMEERRRFPSSSFRINREEQLPYRRLVFPQPLGWRSASTSNPPELMDSQARFKAVLPWPTIPSRQ